jgi:hypothetical protein
VFFLERMPLAGTNKIDHERLRRHVTESKGVAATGTPGG